MLSQSQYVIQSQYQSDLIVNFTYLHLGIYSSSIIIKQDSLKFFFFFPFFHEFLVYHYLSFVIVGSNMAFKLRWVTIKSHQIIQKVMAMHGLPPWEDCYNSTIFFLFPNQPSWDSFQIFFLAFYNNLTCDGVDFWPK